MAIKWIYRYESSQNPKYLLCPNWQAYPKIHMENWGKKSQKNFVEEEESWRTCFWSSNLQYHYNKTVSHCHKDRQIDQWNRIDSSRNKFSCLLSADFHQGCQDSSKWGKNSFSINSVGDNWIPFATGYHLQKNEVGVFPHTVDKH